MATTTKKGAKNRKAKLHRPVAQTSVAEQAQTIAELRQQLAESLQRKNATAKELQDRNRQLIEALEQQTASRGDGELGTRLEQRAVTEDALYHRSVRWYQNVDLSSIASVPSSLSGSICQSMSRCRVSLPPAVPI